MKNQEGFAPFTHSDHSFLPFEVCLVQTCLVGIWLAWWIEGAYIRWQNIHWQKLWGYLPCVPLQGNSLLPARASCNRKPIQKVSQTSPQMEILFFFSYQIIIKQGDERGRGGWSLSLLKVIPTISSKDAALWLLLGSRTRPWLTGLQRGKVNGLCLNQGVCIRAGTNNANEPTAWCKARFIQQCWGFLLRTGVLAHWDDFPSAKAAGRGEGIFSPNISNPMSRLILSMNCFIRSVL